MAQNRINQQYYLYFQRVSVLYQRPEIKASLEIILSVFAVTMLVFLAIRPTITNIFSLQKRITDQEVVVKKIDNKITQLISAQKQISDNPSSISLLQEAVPTTFEYFTYGKRIEILANQNGVSLEVINFPGGVLAGNESLATIPREKAKNYIQPDKDSLISAKVSFTVVGDQAGVFGFLSDLENMDKVALIDSIEITKTQRSALQSRQLLTVTGQVYFYALANKTQ